MKAINIVSEFNGLGELSNNEKILVEQIERYARTTFVEAFNKMDDDDVLECQNGYSGRVFDRIIIKGLDK